LDPAVKAGFGFVVGKSASPSSTPGSAFLWCSSVRPSSRQARRTAPPVINGVNALAFGTLFSSQGASADPKEGTPRRWGRATHHGRHVGSRRQPSLPRARRFGRSIAASRALERSFGPCLRQDPGLAGAFTTGIRSEQQGRARTLASLYVRTGVA